MRGRLLPFYFIAKALVRNRRIFGQLSACARQVPSGVPPDRDRHAFPRTAHRQVRSGQPMAGSFLGELSVLVRMPVPAQSLHDALGRSNARVATCLTSSSPPTTLRSAAFECGSAACETAALPALGLRVQSNSRHLNCTWILSPFDLAVNGVDVGLHPCEHAVILMV